MRRIIIPCGGKAVRFGGIRKELLPLSPTPGDTPLRRAVGRALGAGADVLIVSSVDQIAAHVQALPNLPISYRVADGDLWGAILAGLDDCDGGLLLPDTVWTGAFPAQTTAPITFGVFETNEPQRYSVVQGGRILTKQPGAWSSAWGCVLWSRDAVRKMRSGVYAHYDRAFEAAMELGYTTFPIADYHDLGTWDAYRRFVME